MAKPDENFFFSTIYVGKNTTYVLFPSKAPEERSLGLWGREPYPPPRLTFGPDTLNLENIYACPELCN